MEDKESDQIKKKAAALGLSVSAYVRQILRDSIRKSTQENPADTSLKNARAQVVVLAEALGRTQKATPEVTDKLIKTLLRIFDQEVGK